MLQVHCTYITIEPVEIVSSGTNLQATSIKGVAVPDSALFTNVIWVIGKGKSTLLL
jgi:hypothetical protein